MAAGLAAGLQNPGRTYMSGKTRKGISWCKEIVTQRLYFKRWNQSWRWSKRGIQIFPIERVNEFGIPNGDNWYQRCLAPLCSTTLRLRFCCFCSSFYHVPKVRVRETVAKQPRSGFLAWKSTTSKIIGMRVSWNWWKKWDTEPPFMPRWPPSTTSKGELF